MRWLSLALLFVGCFKNTGPLDPNNPDLLAPCPSDRAHLTIALATRDYEAVQSVLRTIEGSYEQCQGIVVPYEDYGYIHTVGGLPDGTDVVGFRDAYTGGLVVRFDGTEELGRIADDALYPIGISAIMFDGQEAIAIAWAGGTPSSSDWGERITVHARSNLAQLGGWDVGSQSIRAAAPLTGQGSRMSVLVSGAGLQEMRADPGATTLATTGELTVSMPSNAGSGRSLDVVGGLARVAGDNGVLYYQHEQGGNAFLGPVYCRWPATTGSPLPSPEADYRTALIDPSDPEDLSIVLVDGLLEGSDTSATHVFTLTHRGECELLFSIPDTHSAVAIAIAGR